MRKARPLQACSSPLSAAGPRAVAIALAAILAAGEPCAAQESEVLPAASETARRQGEADRMQDTPSAFDVSVSYTADVWRNSGGARDGWRYLDNLDVTAELDLDAAAGWSGARAFAYVLYNNGRSLSDLTGDAQAASNIETGVRALRLYEAWIEQDVAPGASVKLGLYDVNSEFDALEASSLFIGSAHGVGTDFSQSGGNGPSIFPVTSLGIRVQAQPVAGLTLRAAVLDGVPGDPDHPRRTTIRLGHGDGALLVGEADWTRGPVRVLAGGWAYTRELERHDGSGTAPSRGAYLRAEAVLAEGEGRTFRAFARTGLASGQANMFAALLSGGLTLDLPGTWQLGGAIAHARTSAPWRRAMGGKRAETALELTLAKAITPWLSIQPDVQYVIDPAAEPGRADALVTGLRVTFQM